MQIDELHILGAGPVSNRCFPFWECLVVSALCSALYAVTEMTDMPSIPIHAIQEILYTSFC